MLKKQDHIHKLKRHTYKTTGHQVFFCTDDKCSYKVDVGLALGKTTICHRCGSEFKMNELSIRMAKPHCMKCGRKRVTDDSGKVTYIRPAASVIMAEVANDTTSRLEDLLRGTTTPKDEDEI